MLAGVRGVRKGVVAVLPERKSRSASSFEVIMFLNPLRFAGVEGGGIENFGGDGISTEELGVLLALFAFDESVPFIVMSPLTSSRGSSCTHGKTLMSAPCLTNLIHA